MPPLPVRLLLAPLLVWTVNFFGGYGLALALPTSALLDPLIAVLTACAMGALWLLWRRSASLGSNRALARQAVTISALAIAWQGLVILF